MKSTIIITTIGATLLAASMSGIASDDYGWFGFKRTDFAPAGDTVYKQECGACHFAYQPGMLPAASWERIMQTLEDHFGDNAELSTGTRQHVSAYLKEHAAERSQMGRSPAVARSLKGEAPMRFTETAYFRRKHHELPPRLARDNPQVRSMSNCAACHVNASDGDYDEHGVRIPGFGHWDD